MPKMKTNKALTKKVRVTRTGKVVVRTTGQNHYNAKNSGKETRAKRSDRVLFPGDAKNIRAALR